MVTAPDGTVLISGYAEQRAFPSGPPASPSTPAADSPPRVAGLAGPPVAAADVREHAVPQPAGAHPSEAPGLGGLHPARVERMRPVVERITADLLDALPGAP
ncbi:hypothetical protein LT493_32520 [Streptomyces tricolor]|nr:hypothetical protein [Streptomyces tricolor]